MISTRRGRGATRAVVVAVLITLLALVTALLVVNAANAQAAVPDDAAREADETSGAAVRSSDGGPFSLALARDAAVAAAERARDALAAVADATPPPPPPPPPAFCPAPGSEFVDSWGFARSGGRRHQGVDMMAPYGTPVLAPVAGTVRASHSSLGGIGFYLDDAVGNVYFGSHLASLDVTGPVEAGQQIGTVGSTGNAGTPHLHFEVHPGDAGAVNPFPFAFNWCTADFADPEATVLLP